MGTTYHFSTGKIVVFYISALICGAAIVIAVAARETALAMLLVVVSQLISSGLLLRTSRGTSSSHAPST